MAADVPSPAWFGLSRRLRRHRRHLAAVLLAVAAGTVVHAALPEPSGATLVTVARDLPAGHVLSASDLTTASVPERAVPDGALGPEALEGARLASALRAGEPVTDARLSGAGLVGALPPGTVAVPVQLAAHVRPWLAVGQRVRLHPGSGPSGADGWLDPTGTATTGGTGGAAPVVEDATVLDIAGAPVEGLLAGSGADGSAGVAVLLQVPAPDAARLASAGGPVAAVLLGSS